MWYIFQARLHGDDEDALHVVQADSYAAAALAAETTIRTTDSAPLCAACAAAEEPNIAAEACAQGCLPFYIVNSLECASEPR